MRRFDGSKMCVVLPGPSRSICLISAALVIVLSSCSRSETPKTETATQGAQTKSKKVVVTLIELGHGVTADNRITEAADSFAAKDTVYASVAMTGAPPNTQVTARWASEDGQVVSESTQMIPATENTPTGFHVVKPEGLPPGKYKLELVVNGEVLAERVFRVIGA